MDRKITNIKERILYFIENQGEKKEDFFQKLNLSYSNFKGPQKNSALGSDAIDRILTKYINLNPDWLITGRGDMLRKTYSNNMIAPVLNPGSIDIGNRIDIVRQNNGYSQDAFSEVLKLDPSYYSKIKQGKMPPTLSFCIELCCVFTISLDWLIFGYAVESDEILSETQNSDPIKDILINNQQQLIDYKDQEISTLKKEITELKKASEQGYYYDRVAEDQPKLK
ncbi:helix-turn-helix domain-containing protein [Chryseobacterium koreense]|uniref:helix-turn-helix domain-containing protein n=1 Tax=Chryseobacterium koreense TaxID=232216 RepID=UPI00069E8DF2|nr:helix-turn-helix transcriptional regulator [Chryseobacterium koreense]MBB5334866.1 transcriptional regulator with XRE-family HTH domain [Chryseobacterium koreense]